MWNYDYTVPETKRFRYIIHTDCKNEADDQFTVAHALMTDKLEVKGIIAGHFNTSWGRFPDGTTATESYKEIEKIVDLMHLTGKYPVLMGSQLPLKDEFTPQDCPGARFIIEEAMKDDPRPLFIGMQGAITDLASAILMEPEICHKMTCIWIGGAKYPQGGREFNLMQDITAANVVMASDMPVWQVPSNVYKQFATTLTELQVKVKPYGKIGNYLFQQMVDFNIMRANTLLWPHGESWGLGDEGCIAALLLEQGRDDIYEYIEAPHYDSEMNYVLGVNKDKRKVRFYHLLDARMDLEDLFAKLQVNFPEKDS